MCLGCDWAPQVARFGGGPRATRSAAFGEAPIGASPTVSVAPKAVSGEPDFVFHNGPIFTVAGSAPWAQAVAVTGTTISYVGGEAAALALAGPATTVVDLDGRLLMPGFVEGHIHPFFGSFVSAGVICR